MRFGRSAEEAKEEPSRGGGGGQYMRYLKDGDNTFRILQEPDEWKYYWEHFNPAGFSFPCPRAADDPIEDCPGCSSEIEKMKKVNRRIAFNILHSFNGTEYVDVMKVGPTVSEKLENRYKRFGTITDRDYTVTRYKTSADRYDFDVEGGTPSQIDLRKDDWKDVEELLQAAWDDAWGDGGTGAQAAAAVPARARVTIAPSPKQEEPPFEPAEREYKEADLRRMHPEDLLKLINHELDLVPPESLVTSDELTDWLMNLQ